MIFIDHTSYFLLNFTWTFIVHCGVNYGSLFLGWPITCRVCSESSHLTAFYAILTQLLRNQLFYTRTVCCLLVEFEEEKNPLNTSTQWLRIVNGHIFAKAKNLRNYCCLFKMEIFDQIRKGSDSRDTFPRLIYRFLKTKISRSTSNYKLFWTLFGSVWKNLDSAPI